MRNILVNFKLLKRIVFFNLLTSFSSSWAIESLTVGQYLELKYAKDKPSKEIVETYISGIGQGILFASVYSATILKNKPIICPPANYKITGYTALELLDEKIKNSSARLSEIDVSVVLTDSFAKRFPCPK